MCPQHFSIIPFLLANPYKALCLLLEDHAHEFLVEYSLATLIHSNSVYVFFLTGVFLVAI